MVSRDRAGTGSPAGTREARLEALLRERLRLDALGTGETEPDWRDRAIAALEGPSGATPSENRTPELATVRRQDEADAWEAVQPAMQSTIERLKANKTHRCGLEIKRYGFQLGLDRSAQPGGGIQALWCHNQLVALTLVLRDDANYSVALHANVEASLPDWGE